MIHSLLNNHSFHHHTKIATINAPAQEIRENEERLFPSPSAIIRDHKSLLLQSNPIMNSQQFTTTTSTNTTDSIVSLQSSSSLVQSSINTSSTTKGGTQRISSSFVSSPTTSNNGVNRGKLSIVSSKSHLNLNHSSPQTPTNSTNNMNGSSPQTNETTSNSDTSDTAQQQVDGKSKVSNTVTYVNKAPCEFKNRKIIAQKKTEIVYNNLNPIFSNEFLIVNNIRDASLIKNWLLTLEVYDYDYVKYDDCKLLREADKKPAQ